MAGYKKDMERYETLEGWEKLSLGKQLDKWATQYGDRIAVTATNTNQTISQILKNFFYKIAGNDTYQIAARHSGIVTAKGTTSVR